MEQTKKCFRHEITNSKTHMCKQVIYSTNEKQKNIIQIELKLVTINNITQICNSTSYIYILFFNSNEEHHLVTQIYLFKTVVIFLYLDVLEIAVFSYKHTINSS